MHVDVVLTAQGLERIGQQLLVPRRIVGNTKPSTGSESADAAPPVADGDTSDIRIKPAPLKKSGGAQPTLKDLPKRLMCASPQDRELMLKDLHERFWHAPPADMMRLLQAACLPKDIVQQGIDVASCCSCRQDVAPRMHRPQIKSHFAIKFNETVQHDLLSRGLRPFRRGRGHGRKLRQRKCECVARELKTLHTPSGAQGGRGLQKERAL